MSGSQAIVRRSWPRLVVVHALQLTDSRWRWWNRLLLAEAVAWLTVALVLGT
jgi:hypothetical protein